MTQGNYFEYLLTESRGGHTKCKHQKSKCLHLDVD